MGVLYAYDVLCAMLCMYVVYVCMLCMYAVDVCLHVILCSVLALSYVCMLCMCVTCGVCVCMYDTHV